MLFCLILSYRTSQVNTPILSESGKLALEQGLKTGKTHTFRTRCQYKQELALVPRTSID